jgi:hypothetical protein
MTQLVKLQLSKQRGTFRFGAKTKKDGRGLPGHPDVRARNLLDQLPVLVTVQITPDLGTV